jgi:hypothetical protein
MRLGFIFAEPRRLLKRSIKIPASPEPRLAKREQILYNEPQQPAHAACATCMVHSLHMNEVPKLNRGGTIILDRSHRSQTKDMLAIWVAWDESS